MILTVTLNAAIDRTVLVPSFQIGHRHRASAALASAGGKGVNLARTLRHLGIPVVCTGLAGGRTGVQIVERLTSEGLLNDFVRIRDESRTSTAVIDPTSSVATEIYEWGPEVGDDELQILREKLAYLSRGAEFVVFSGSLPRGVDDGFYAEVIRETNRRGIPTVLDAQGEPLLRGVEAEPYLVSPNVREAEQLVGHEFNDENDLTLALEEVAQLGARNVLITMERGCFALFRGDRTELRLDVRAPRFDPVSPIGAGDALLAGFLAARVLGKSLEDAVRQAVATGAASVLESEPGRVDLKEVARIVPDIDIRALEPINDAG